MSEGIKCLVKNIIRKVIPNKHIKVIKNFYENMFYNDDVPDIPMAEPINLFPKYKAEGFVLDDNGYLSSKQNILKLTLKLNCPPQDNMLFVMVVGLYKDTELTIFADDILIISKLLNKECSEVSFHLRKELFNQNDIVELILNIYNANLIIKSLTIDEVVYKPTVNSENYFYILKTNHDILKIKLLDIVKEKPLIAVEVANTDGKYLIDILFTGNLVATLENKSVEFSIELDKYNLNKEYLDLMLVYKVGKPNIKSISVNRVVYYRLPYDYNISESSDMVHRKLVSKCLSSGCVLCE